QDLLRREIDYDEEFQDSPEVARAYDEAAAAIDDVLRVAPDHWKTRMLKAALVFRRDRESGRPVALEILQALAAADPTNKQIPFTIRKIERPCVRCGDTGFCPHCKGRGQRRFLRMDSKCEQCYGRGICPTCGVLSSLLFVVEVRGGGVLPFDPLDPVGSADFTADEAFPPERIVLEHDE